MKVTEMRLMEVTGKLLLGVVVLVAACTVDLSRIERDATVKDGTSTVKDGTSTVKDGKSTADAISTLPGCGDGVVGTGETCDLAIPEGQAGACPTGCDDGFACTQDMLVGENSCQARCTYSKISECKHGDGCCPGTCNAISDDDCSASCGNGTVEAKETCDIQIASGQPGACPTQCDDGDVCTEDDLIGAGSCSAACRSRKIELCLDDDGCCPKACNQLSDSDCSSVCGNGVLEKGEQCDTAIPTGKAGACPTSCNKPVCIISKLTGSGCQRKCEYTYQQDTAPCSGGLCYRGHCCFGCWTGTSCVAGTDSGKCGVKGEDCKNCGYSTGCVEDSCNDAGICEHANFPDGTKSCFTGSPGKCYEGHCCTGCWDGQVCQTGRTPAHCGYLGSLCVSCGAILECKERTCSAGKCGTVNRPDGTTCTGGTCTNGLCNVSGG